MDNETVEILDDDSEVTLTDNDEEEKSEEEIEEFTRGKKIGSGAYKKVYRAYRHEDGMESCWNEVSLLGISERELDEIVKEVALLKKLKSEYIIEIYAHWVNDKKQRLIFITELLSSGTIKEYIENCKKVSLSSIKKWSKDILKGLDYLHKNDIIHRDLKCENIFINGVSGIVKIGDFGLSTFKVLKKKSVKGTTPFIAPELFEGEYDEKVDIYAFGMTVLEMVSGRYPYCECKSDYHVMKNVENGIPPESLKRCKVKEVKNFIELCITPDPKKRPTAETLLKHPFYLPKDHDKKILFSKGRVSFNKKTLKKNGEMKYSSTRSNGSIISNRSEGEGSPPTPKRHESSKSINKRIKILSNNESLRKLTNNESSNGDKANENIQTPSNGKNHVKQTSSKVSPKMVDAMTSPVIIQKKKKAELINKDEIMKSFTFESMKPILPDATPKLEDFFMFNTPVKKTNNVSVFPPNGIGINSIGNVVKETPIIPEIKTIEKMDIKKKKDLKLLIEIPNKAKPVSSNKPVAELINPISELIPVAKLKNVSEVKPIISKNNIIPIFPQKITKASSTKLSPQEQNFHNNTKNSKTLNVPENTPDIQNTQNKTIKHSKLKEMKDKNGKTVDKKFTSGSHNAKPKEKNGVIVTYNFDENGKEIAIYENNPDSFGEDSVGEIFLKIIPSHEEEEEKLIKKDRSDIIILIYIKRKPQCTKEFLEIGIPFDFKCDNLKEFCGELRRIRQIRMSLQECRNLQTELRIKLRKYKSFRG